ncbi:hypothetical protein AALP_AA2G195000 [Arabis alpina]|uniref:NmrA-like domain-containing protein n=1 Tax=Arabis alpina TaxID=50452 RepID=A0A087HIL3_ARAAL|nr:hypothetical protein AALP_AA2G195000 [Arabis alpina]
METTKKNKILIIGGTGCIGKFIVRETAKAGHQTFALVREASFSDAVKGKTVKSFKDLGVTILHGDLNDHESLVKAIKQVDVVISTVGRKQLLDQTNIISAIKESGNIKRFLPSEFGTDVDNTNAVEPAKSLVFGAKRKIRRAVEAEGIPYTYVVGNCAAGFYLPSLAQFQPRPTSPPRDKITILGDGNAKVVLNKEEDVAAYMIKTIDDPRTLNKTLYINPLKNILSMNEIVNLWERKIGKSLEKTYMKEEQVLKNIQVSPDVSVSVLLSINHSVFVKGHQTNFIIDPSLGVEASKLYPDVKFTSVDEYLDQFA